MPTPTELIVLPNVELVVVKYLQANLVGAQIGPEPEDVEEVEVGLVVPKDEAILDHIPFVRVARRAGIGRHLVRFDGPIVDIDVWHATNADVNTLGEIVRGYMAAMRWHQDDELGAMISKVVEVTGPQRLPEDIPQIVRLGFTVGLTVRSFIPA